MRATPGFCGALLVVHGERMFSISGRTDVDGPRRINGEGPHREAIDAVMRHDLTLGGMHSLWSSQSMRVLVRRDGCGAVADALRTNRRCPRCGDDIGSRVRYL